MSMRTTRWSLLLPGLFMLGDVMAAPGIPALVISSNADGVQSYSLSIQVLLAMTALTLLPAAMVMMTSFTRIIVVLAILRQALGTAQTPTNQILVGLALFLTIFVMSPVFGIINEKAVQPYMAEQMQAEEAVRIAAVPIKQFMLDQTREADLGLFLRLSGNNAVTLPADVPFVVAVPAFVTSELKTAFQIGFLLFIPFLIIDLVVASVLMSMGMMMMSPMMVSLPFKIMLFVLVDGWGLIISTLASSFYMA
jgi:flagellar biosynthetic protein FliP